jgi:hypothetical protein
VRDYRVVRPGWVVELSQVKMNATTHGEYIVRLQKKVNQDALAEDLGLVDLIKGLSLALPVPEITYI